MHIFGLHSPSRCWILKVFLFSILIFYGVFILSLSNQVLGSHCPFRCLVYTLQSHFFFFLGKIIFILSLSDQVLSSHFPCAYLIDTLQADIGFYFFIIIFFFYLNFSWGFHPLALQTCFTFSLSMQMLDFKISILFFLHLDFSSRFTSFILSLSKQVVSSHSQYRSLVYTLQADVIVFIKCKTRTK